MNIHTRSTTKAKQPRYNARPKRYTFFNGGTGYSFDPSRNATVNNKLSNLLELHLAEMRFRNRPDVFILSDTGEYVTEAS